MAKVYEFPAGGRNANSATTEVKDLQLLARPSRQTAEAQAFIALQPKMFRDELREITTRAPGPFAAIIHDTERALIVDGRGRPVSEDLFHRSHAGYVAEFLNLHAAEKQ